MKYAALFPIIATLFLSVSCVSKETHLETVVELEQSRRQAVESDLKGKVVQGQLEQAQKDMKAQKQEMDALKTKLRESSGRLTVLEKDLATAKQTVAGGTNQIASLTKERDDLKGIVPLQDK